MSILSDMIKNVEQGKKNSENSLEIRKKQTKLWKSDVVNDKTIRTQQQKSAYAERTQARSAKIKEIDAEINRVNNEKNEALAPYIKAYNDAYNSWYIKSRMRTATPDDVKKRDNAKKALEEQQEKYKTMLAGTQNQKAQIAAEQKMDDVGNRYNIDIEDFDEKQFEKWAKDNNFERIMEPMEGDLGVYTPKREGGFLGFGGKKLTTKQQEEDYAVLAALAKSKLDEETAKEYPVMSSAVTMMTAPARGIQGLISTVEDSINVSQGKEINLFSPNKSLARMSRTMRKTVDEEYASKWFGGAEAPLIGNVGSALYNAGMSIGDNVVNMAVGAYIGKAASVAGLSANATKNIVSGVTSSLMASDATVNSIIANKERGLSDGKALVLGIANGMTELATEKFSIDKIIENPADSLKKVIIKGMAAEGTEEMTSETLNKFLDGVVNQENSEMQIAIRNYIEDGKTKEEAVALAWGDMLSDILGAGITGAFSGAAMGGTFNTVNTLTDKHQTKQTIKELNTVAQKVNESTGKEKLQPLSDDATKEEIAEYVQEIGKLSAEINAEMQSSAHDNILGENGKKAFRSNFREGQNETDYASGFRRMYNLGQSNITIEQAKEEIRGNKYIQSLSPDQRMAAYYAGQNDAKAQLEAEKSTVKFVKYYSEDAGVVENDAAKKVNKKELASIDKLARSVGAQVIFEEDIEDFNGYVELGKIHISLNAENKLAVVAAHEVTHRMQELAPESYRKYRDFVMSTVGVGVVESYQEKLHSKDIYLSDSEVMDEIAADYTKKILSDPKRMQQFVDDALNGKLDTTASIAENRNILQKLFDSIKEFIKKVSDKFSGRKAEQNQAARDAYGVDLETLKHAKNLLQKALKDSADMVGQFEKQEKTTTQTDVKEKVKYSYKGVTQTGIRKYVSDFPSNMPQEQRVELFKERISTVFNLGMVKLKTDVKKIEVRGDKFTYKKNIKGDEKAQSNEMEAKTNALYDLADILASSRFAGVEIEESYKDASKKPKNKAHKGVKYWYKFKNTIIFDGIMYDVTFNIRDKGKEQYQYLIDFKEIKKRTTQVSHTVKNNLRQAFELSSNERVSQKSDSVNTQFMQNSKNNSQRKNSVKMDEDFIEKHERLTKAYVMLNEELRRLKNEKGTFRQEKIATVAKKILNDFDFAYDAELLSEQMNGLAEDTKQMIEGKMDFDTFKSKVLEISKDVIETGAKTDSAEYQQSKAMRDYLRTTKITLSEDARNNLGEEYETIRKRTFGRLRLVKEGGTPIDVVYRELSELYPMYFSAETETNASAQLRQIQSVLDGLKSLKDDVFNGYTDEAAEWLSGLIIDKIYNEVFVSGETGKTNVSVDMKAMRNEMADNLQRVMDRERQWREREYNKLQSKFEKKTKNYTEARQKSIKIQQIKLHTERLSKALLNPSERFAVPEDLKKPVAEFLSCINLENDRLGERTRETLGDLMNTYRKIAEQEYELGMVLDPQLVYNIEDISEAVKELGVKDKRVSDLDLVTLEKLRTSIMSMETMLRNYNQTFRDGKKQQIDILAAKACEEIKERVKGIKKNSKIGAVKSFSDMLNFDMLNPWDYFHQMGGTFEELFSGLREGENRQIKNLARGKEYLEEMTEKHGISKKDMTDKSIKTFKLANGETLELTKAQVMSLYLLWRQNQTHEHITEGGIRPAKVTQKLIESKDGESKVKMSVSEDYNAVRANLDDIGTILETLSDNEKRFAESISDFFVDECAEWGNEVALKLFGYKKFNTPNYFPIVSDKMYLQEDFGVSADSTIKNMGITKRRIKHANNPIIIEDIFDVYARHVSDMAKYNAYVLPLQDVQRVFNSRGFDGENNVKALVATKFGKQAVDYFSKLMVDINMGINNQYGNALSSNLISKYKQAKMGLNARVVVQQPVSYIRAAALIDPKYMTKAMGQKVDIETVFKYSPIAQWKSWGFFSTDTGKDMYSLMTGEKDLSDYTMALAGKADEMTWKRIWAAVELETADLHPDLQKGSEAFYEACGKRFDEIIDRTQVVDSTLHRSQALRSPDGFTKMAYSFMSEPLKTYNLLRTAAVDMISAKDAESKKKLTRTIAVCAVSSVVLACITGAFDTLSGDEEEEFVKNFGENLLSDALGMMPYVKDIYSVAKGFTIERMDMQGLGDVVNAVLMVSKDNYTWKYKITNLLAKTAELGGVPVGSFKKSIYDLVVKNIIRGVDKQWVSYNMAKQMYRIDGGKKGEFLDILFDAYRSNNKKEYNKIFKDMIKEGLDAKTIESGLKSRLKKSRIKKTFDVPWNATFELPETEKEDKFGLGDLTGSQYTNYQTKMTALNKEISADLRRMKSGLTETDYQKRLKTAYEYSVETALEEAARGKYESEKPWINKAQTAEEKYGLDPAEFIMFYRYYNDLTPPAGQEKFKSGEKKSLIIDYLNGMELTAEEWQYLYREVAGYKK